MLVYHFVGGQHGLDNIRRRRLKIAKLDELNDPFELLAALSFDPEIRRMFKAIKAELAVSRGILCFSRKWTNPVQWSHYADRHRGLCLGFEIPDHMLMPVEYSSRRLRINLATLSSSDAAAEAEMQKMLCTKFSHWRYESEVRCFASLDEKDKESGLYFAPFSSQLELKRVVVGHSSSISRAELKDALGDMASSVSADKARLAFGSFKVVKQKKGSLWL